MAVIARYHFVDNNSSVAYCQLRLGDRTIAIGSVVALLRAVSDAHLFRVEVREPLGITAGTPLGTFTLSEVVYSIGYQYRIVRLPISDQIFYDGNLDHRPTEGDLPNFWLLLDEIGTTIYGEQATALVY